MRISRIAFAMDSASIVGAKLFEARIVIARIATMSWIKRIPRAILPCKLPNSLLSFRSLIAITVLLNAIMRPM